MRHLFFSILLSLVALPAFAQDQRPWWDFWQSTDSVKKVINANNGNFSQKERAILNDYLRDRVLGSRDADDDNKGKYKNKHKGKKKPLPPGLKKKLERGGELPPGWQKKVAKGQVLGQDLYRSSHRLPRDIIDILPTGPDNTSIRRIDDRIVRVRHATNVILDVLGGHQ